MSRVYSGDLAVATFGGNDLLDILKNVRYSGDVDNVEGSGIPNFGMTAQAVGLGGTFEINHMSTLSTPTRVSHLDVGAFTIDGTSYISMLKRGSVEGSFTVQEGKGVSDKWRWPVITKKDYSMRAELMIPRSGTANALRTIAGDLHGATISDLNMPFSVTINSVATTIAGLLTSARIIGSDGDLTMVECEFKGRSPDSGSYPAAPTSGSTLLALAFTAPGTPFAYSFTPHDDSAEGANIAGNAVFGGFGFDFNVDELISERYTLLTHGAVTQTNAA